jgi:hypothetical protein
LKTKLRAQEKLVYALTKRLGTCDLNEFNAVRDLLLKEKIVLRELRIKVEALDALK